VHLELNQGWTVTARAGDIPPELMGVAVPATVPGCVHLDLLAAGLIPDPFLDTNEQQLTWIGRVDWQYRTSFEWDGTCTDEQIELVALGLDTVASIELNGTKIADVANMHRSYRFSVRAALKVGRNELTVTFAAGVSAAQRFSTALGPRPLEYPHPFNAVRKMACNYGWDWGPDVVTAGIWKPLSLQSWSTARLASVRPLVEVEVETGTGRLRAHVDVQRADGFVEALTVEVQVGGQDARGIIAAGATSVVVTVDVPDVAVWWPHGYGDQPLYPVAVSLSRGPDRCDEWTGRVGFRNIALDTTADEHGTPFVIKVNDQVVFGRGVNWIPDDAFLTRVGRDRYKTRLTQARDANVNLVRVWGGGIYETEEFYDCCDELGLLVWQDFLFACAAYAEEEPLRAEVIAEAREAVARLSPHPSLAMWNGCNENIWGYADWGWQEALGGRTWGWGYYTEVLPAIVAELDPTRPYCPGSPYSMTPDIHPNDPAHGTMHIWDVWNDRDYTAYRDYVPRFCSEFGFQGPPTWSTLTRAVHDDPLTPDSDGMLTHQKAADGNGKLARGLRPHLPVPATIEDWHWAMSLNQARAVAFGIEHFRSWSPICAGTVVWQLNDCWPVTSWAAIDGDGRPKPLWYALRRAFADRLLTVQPRADGLALVAVNDSAQPWRANAEFSRRSWLGTVLAKGGVSLDVAPRSTTTLLLPADIAAATDPSSEVVLVECDDERVWWPFTEDVDSSLPPAEFDCVAETSDRGYRITVTARTAVRDLAVLADRVASDATVNDMLVTLLPGDTARFEVMTGAAVDPYAFTDPSVLRSANQLLGVVTSSDRYAQTV
jgi:beta-mannosidase